MSEPKFDKSGHLKLIDYEGKTCCLLRNTWETKTKYPEREFLRFNFDQIELTITYPDEVRRSTQTPDSKILYRKFSRMTIKEGITIPWVGYIAVIIDGKSGLVKTIYATRKMKKGEKLWPK